MTTSGLLNEETNSLELSKDDQICNHFQYQEEKKINRPGILDTLINEISINVIHVG